MDFFILIYNDQACVEFHQEPFRQALLRARVLMMAPVIHESYLGCPDMLPLALVRLLPCSITAIAQVAYPAHRWHRRSLSNKLPRCHHTMERVVPWKISKPDKL